VLSGGQDAAVSRGQDGELARGRDAALARGQDGELARGQDAAVAGEQDGELAGDQDAALARDQDAALARGQDGELARDQDAALAGDQDGELARGQDAALAGEPDTAALADGDGAPGLRASLEAIMLVADEPVSEVVIAQVLERPRAEVAAALRELATSYVAEQRGFDLREIAGGWRFYTREECAPVVERFVSDGQEVRLTQAALETLAVVAYRQPVSRARVSAVRGVNCDGVIRTLVLRGLVEEVGTDPETGAILFATTAYFLERLGLPGLDALPELAPFLPDHIDDESDPGHESAES
jgi:segregation and condensation protein B